MSLQNKIAIVTGASRGIGLATCKRFINENIENLIMIGSNSKNLTFAKEQLSCKNIFTYQCDLSNKDSIDITFEEILLRFSHIDILVNNAGIINDSPFVEMSDTQIEQVLNVNFYGPFYCMQKVLPLMIKQNYGKIVNLSSTSKFGTVNKSNYAASKAALDALTRTAAKEVARYNITINSIAPSLIDTDMLKSIPKPILSELIDNSPMKRLGKPDEIASIIYFLSSDDSSYITGETLIASGGLLTV